MKLSKSVVYFKKNLLSGSTIRFNLSVRLNNLKVKHFVHYEDMIL